MNEPSFDEMVQTVHDRVCTPRRRDEPRLAPPLAGIDRVMASTPHGNVAAWRVGTGPATLLVHGWQDDSSLWTPLMRALLEVSEPFVAFDLPAHGFSEGDRCLATCKTRPNTDEVVACAAMCPGARADHGFCERRIDDEGEPGELFPGCVESTHVNVRRIAWIAGGVAIGVVVVLALGALALASTPTH